MPKLSKLSLLVFLFLACAAAPAFGRTPALRLRFLSAAPAVNDREQDGLIGPVRRVKTETAKITVKNGQPAEGSRVLLEATTYDMKGNRVDNAYYLSAGGTLTGKEVYKYDARGNMIEMTLHNADGSLLSKETYAYEFDAVGNWVKMTTSVAVIEAGRVTFEPSEVTYRTIAYYLDEGMLAKMTPGAAQPAAPSASQPAPKPSPSVVPASMSNANGSQPNAGAAKPAASPQPSPQNQSAQKKAAAGVSAPLAVASMDKAVAPAPAMLGSGSSSSGAGPVVSAEGEAPAAKPVMRGPLKPVSGGILNGKALNLPAPTYPELARRARAQGVVEVEVVIGLDGKVISAKAVKGPIMLQVAAEEAARRAKFSPTLLSGQPVKVMGLISYNFNLE